MPKYILVLARRDEADNPGGGRRKKEGDIICVVPENDYIGPAVVADYLLLPIESDLNYDEIREKLMVPTTGYANRFSVPLTKLKSDHMPALDLTKARKKGYEDIYQPFVKKSRINSTLLNKRAKSLTTKPALSEDSAIDLKGAVELIYDKKKSKYLQGKALKEIVPENPELISGLSPGLFVVGAVAGLCIKDPLITRREFLCLKR